MIARVTDLDRMFDAMGLLRGRFDRIFDEFNRSVGYGSEVSVSGNYPHTNLYDKGDRFELVAEVPGLRKEDLDIKIQGNYLEISGKREVKGPDGYRIHRNERSSATFTRSLTLPADVDSEKVSASLSDGLLSLNMPKSEAVKPRQISIN